MKIVIAPDSFKESLSADEVIASIKKGFSQVLPNAQYVGCPIADGGEGLLDALRAALGAEVKIFWKELDVLHAMWNEKEDEHAHPIVHSQFAWIPDKKLIIIESALAIGIDTVEPAQRNPMLCNSYGLGQLLAHVYKEYLLVGKATKVLLGIGGTITVDGGTGMAQALGAKYYDNKGMLLSKRGNVLPHVARIDASDMLDFSDFEILVASDVQNPLYGASGAAHVFGPQKGATEEMVEQLDKSLHRYAQLLAQHFSLDLDTHINHACAGAAGGLGMAIPLFCNARVSSGIDIVISLVGLEEEIKDADLLISGEGKVDGQSMQGKVIQGVLQVAQKHRVPVCIIAGALDEGYEVLFEHGVVGIFSTTHIARDWNYIKQHAGISLAHTSRAIAGMMYLGAKSATK